MLVSLYVSTINAAKEGGGEGGKEEEAKREVSVKRERWRAR